MGPRPQWKFDVRRVGTSSFENRASFTSKCAFLCVNGERVLMNPRTVRRDKRYERLFSLDWVHSVESVKAKEGVPGTCWGFRTHGLTGYTATHLRTCGLLVTREPSVQNVNYSTVYK